MIKVWHAKKIPCSIGPFPDFPKEYRLVAEVDVHDDRYEHAHMLTNHIDRDWKTNPEVTLLECDVGSHKYRSTSIGDVFVRADGLVIRCASFGWDLLHTQNGKWNRRDSTTRLSTWFREKRIERELGKDLRAVEHYDILDL